MWSRKRRSARSASSARPTSDRAEQRNRIRPGRPPTVLFPGKCKKPHPTDRTEGCGRRLVPRKIGSGTHYLIRTAAVSRRRQQLSPQPYRIVSEVLTKGEFAPFCCWRRCAACSSRKGRRCSRPIEKVDFSPRTLRLGVVRTEEAGRHVRPRERLGGAPPTCGRTD